MVLFALLSHPNIGVSAPLVASSSMWDSLPISEFGWGGVVLGLVWMLFTGRIVTRREADAKDREIARLWEMVAEKDREIIGFREVVETSNAMIHALMQAAHDRELARNEDQAPRGKVPK